MSSFWTITYYPSEVHVFGSVGSGWNYHIGGIAHNAIYLWESISQRMHAIKKYPLGTHRYCREVLNLVITRSDH